VGVKLMSNVLLDYLDASVARRPATVQ
jgi:hypothetical protein